MWGEQEISSRIIFIELDRGIPHSIAVERMVSRRDAEPTPVIDGHDVENCGTVDEPDLWHHNSGDCGWYLHGFCQRWRLGFQPTELWWVDGVADVTTPRPFISWWMYVLPSKLKAPKLREWMEQHVPDWMKRGRATRFSLWRCGYRRIRELPGWIPDDDPFANMCEGDTICCQECQRTFPTADGHVYQAFPAMEYRDGKWVEGYDTARAAARWLAAELLDDAAYSWGTACGVTESAGEKRRHDSSGKDWTWFVRREFEDRLEHEAKQAAARDAAPERAGWKRELRSRDRAAKRFPAEVKRHLELLSRELLEDVGTETVDHVCPHVWFEEGVGWTGPGFDP